VEEKVVSGGVLIKAVDPDGAAELTDFKFGLFDDLSGERALDIAEVVALLEAVDGLS